MLRNLLGFELKYHFKQITFIVAFLLFAGLGILIAQGNFGGSELHQNSPYVVSYITCFLSLFAIFVSTLFCANVVLRDTTYEMDGILFTTSIKRLPYFLVRLLGLLTAVFLILCAGVLGIYLGTQSANPDQLGIFKLSYFLQPLLVFGLPNILFCCSVIFSVALLTRNMRAVYMTGVALFILYFLGSILGNSPLMASSAKSTDGSQLLPYLLDPFGITSLMGETRSWPVTARNSRLFPLEGAFLANRLGWMALALVLLILSYRHYRFRLPASEKTRKKKIAAGPITLIPYQSVATQPSGWAYHWATFTAQFKLEVTSVFKHIPFLVMLALWIFLYAVELKENVLYGPYGIRFYASTGSIVEEFVSIRPALLLLIFYAGELIGRERSVNMQGLIFSTPVRNTSLWAAKCTTLAVLIAVLITANICIGIGLQLFTGFPHVDLPAYLSLYYYSGAPLLLLAILIVFIQTVVPNKYLGMLLSLIAVGVIIFARRLGITHALLRYAMLPELQYSPLNGFGHSVAAVHWYLLYWASCAGVLSLLAAALWKGSAHTSFWQRLKTMGRQWQWPGKLIMAICLLGWIASGIYINSQIPPVNTGRTNGTGQDWQVAYEQKYKPQSQLPQPYIIAVRTEVDLYPAAGRYTVKGTYRLRNQSAQPISTLWLGTDPDVTSIQFTIPQARLKTVDEAFNQYFYTLATPLQPGMETTMTFSMEVERSGFAPFNSEHSVVSNGSYIELEKYVPFFGYNDRFETGDAALRKAQGLPPMVATASTDTSYHRIDFETIVSTDPDQQVVTPGTLQKTWQANGRSYFHYKTEQPINFMLALSSARYAVQKEQHRGIELCVYYPPGEAYNLPTLLQAMKDALDYGQANFGPYPLHQLTLAAIPHYPGAATAYPGVVFSAEKINFMSNLSDSSRFNNIYALTAHEVAHQWWANALAPLDAPGRAVLTESLAKYTEFMVTQKRYGRQYLRTLLQADNNLYFVFRNMTGEKELPLMQANEPYLYYQKGGLSLYAIQEMLGEEHMNASLQRLISKHGYPHTKATTTNLLAELSTGATADQAKRMGDLFKQVIVYDNKLRVIRCDSLPDGRFRLQVQVSIGKTNEADGKTQPLTPNEVFTLALYDIPADQWTRHTSPVYQEQHRFTQAVTNLTIVVNKKPALAVIDPYGYWLDADQGNNVAAIQ